MKNKILKTFLFFVLFSTLLITASFAAEIKENVADYESDVYIIGSTRFDANQSITATMAANAGLNEAKVQVSLGNSISDLNVTIYFYDAIFGDWYEINKDAKADLIEDTTTIENIEDNLNIFYEEGVVKTVEVEYEGDIDETSLPSNVEYDEEKGIFIVPATTFNFTFTETKVVNGEEVVIANEVSTNVDKNVISGTEKEPVVEEPSKKYVAKIGNEYFEDLNSAIAKANTDNTVILLSDIDLPTGGLIVDKKVTIDLNGKNLTVKEDTSGDGVFHVVKGGDLTINGDGIVDGVGKNKYNMAVWADGGDVTINGGTYTNTNLTILEEDTDSAHFDLIYAKGEGSDIVINGGRFEGKTPAWLLNLSDNSGATITAYGGTFVGFNPADNESENPKVSFVADGYKVVVNNNEYKVEKLTDADVAMADGIAYKNLQTAVNEVEAGTTIKLLQDIDLPTGGLIVDKKVTIDLNGKNLTVKEDTSGDGVFHVVKGGDLTINGDGIVDGVGKNKYNMAVWADGGDVTINGGTYTNTNLTILEEDTDSAHFDLIYAKGEGSDIVINGGRFEGKTPAWLLNLSDNSGATITAYGGTFVGFNPADNESENPKVSFVAEGYEVIVENDVYTIVEKSN